MTFCEYDLNNEHLLSGIEQYFDRFVEKEWQQTPIVTPVFDDEGWLIGSVPFLEIPSAKAFLKAVTLTCAELLPKDIQLSSSRYSYLKTLFRYHCSELQKKRNFGFTANVAPIFSDLFIYYMFLHNP